jgi:glycosyltransferase involved in cell wall biosynthesis
VAGILQRLGRLSVITPSFGYARFLEQLLDSVATLAVDHEHIVVDGGSEDGTVELLAGRDDPSLTWVSEPDRGQNHAVNKALALVTGDYVSWVNADNAYLPGAVEEAVAILDEDPGVDAVFGGMDIIDEHGVVRRRYIPAPFRWRRYLLQGDYVPTETIVFRRALLAGAPGLDEACGDSADYDFYLRLLHGRRVERIPRPMILYRHHPDAKTTSDPWQGQAAARLVRERWARNAADRALMRGLDRAKRAVLPRISGWPAPYGSRDRNSLR